MPKSAIDDQLAARFSSDDMAANNVLNFGGAATSLAVILMLAQNGIENQEQTLSLACASLALPVWLALALGNVFWVSLRLTYSDFHGQRSLRYLSVCALCIASILLVVSLMSLIWSLSPWIGAAFGVSTIGAVAAVVLAIRAAAPLIEAQIKNKKK